MKSRRESFMASGERSILHRISLGIGWPRLFVLPLFVVASGYSLASSIADKEKSGAKARACGHSQADEQPGTSIPQQVLEAHIAILSGVGYSHKKVSTP